MATTTIYWGITNNTLYLSSIATTEAPTSFAADNTGNSLSYWPWYDSRATLTDVVIQNQINFNATNLSYMFRDCNALTSLNVFNFNTLNVINMRGMFRDCKALTSLDLSNFNTSNVTDMSYMFYNCNALTSLDLSNFDTSNVTDMNNMFTSCYALISLNLSNFNTSNVTNMSNMFGACRTLTLLNLSSFNTIKVSNMSYMFVNCNVLKTIYVSDLWNISNVTSSTAMFNSCSVLVGGNGTSYNSTYIDKTYAIIDGTDSQLGYLTYLSPTATIIYWGIANNILYLSSIPTAEASTSFAADNINTSFSMSYWPWSSSASTLTKVVVQNQINFNATDLSYMFYNCRSLTSLDVSNFNTLNVVSMAYMFENCYALTSLNISNFNTSNVTNMRYMFDRCEALTSLNLSNFNTSNVTSMCNMFSSCYALTLLDLSNFNTSNVTNMYYMFYNCYALTSLNIFSFNTSNVTSMSYMFYGCNVLKTIYVSDLWNISNVSSSDDMFTHCNVLKGGNGTSYDSNHVDVTYAIVDGTNNQPGYLTLGKIITPKLVNINGYHCVKPTNPFRIDSARLFIDKDKSGEASSVPNGGTICVGNDIYTERYANNFYVDSTDTKVMRIYQNNYYWMNKPSNWENISDYTIFTFTPYDSSLNTIDVELVSPPYIGPAGKWIPPTTGTIEAIEDTRYLKSVKHDIIAESVGTSDYIYFGSLENADLDSEVTFYRSVTDGGNISHMMTSEVKISMASLLEDGGMSQLSLQTDLALHFGVNVLDHLEFTFHPYEGSDLEIRVIYSEKDAEHDLPMTVTYYTKESLETNILHLKGIHSFRVKTPRDPWVIDRIKKGYVTDNGTNILTANSDGYLTYTPSSGISIGV